MKQSLFVRQLAAYFETHLPDVRNCSKNTIASYADAFTLLFQFMHETKGIPHERLDYRHFTPAVMEEFTLWMTKVRHYSGASIKQRLSALNSFMKYASRREMAALTAFTVVSGAEKPQTSSSPFPYFTLEEIRILLRLPDTNRKSEKRDLVLLSLFYDCAARAQEMCNLKVGDIRFGSTTKVKLLGKGNKVREVPITADVAKLLRYHIKENELDGKREDPLFSSQRAKKMTTACVRNLVAKYTERGKDSHPELFPETRYSPHSFRHSKAIHMVESGTQLIYIRNFLGHKTVQSTEVYARIGQNIIANMLAERVRPDSNEKARETSVGENRTAYPKFLELAKCK